MTTPSCLHLQSKLTATLASVWIQSTSGAAYCFSIYSPLLKSTQSYSQSTLDTVAFFKDLGANPGVPAGLLYSSLGPRPVLAAGAALCLTGYLMIWMSVTGVLPRQPMPLMCLYMFIAAHSATFFNTADVVTAANNFERYRGTAVGIMKGFLGLSGAILIQAYRAMFDNEPSYFLLMIALLPSLLPLLLMYFVKVHSTFGGDDKKLLDGFSLISLIIAGYLMVVMLLENVLTMGSTACILIFIILFFLLASPISIAVKGQLRDLRLLSEASCHERIQLIDDADLLKQGRGELSNQNESMPMRGENMNLFQAMQTCDFWLLFFATSCGLGSGLATVNNISQIGGSLGYTSTETSTLVSLWSIWNFLGRFSGGYISDYFLHLQGYGRPLFMAITLLTMSIGHALISSGLPGVLYVGSILVGVCYGSQWSLMPIITSEIFGLRHFGTLFNAIAIASPMGSYILSVRLVGYIYDMESVRSGMKTCTGNHCFMLSFLIMTFVCILGFIAALTLFFRTRMFYEQVICARLRHSTAL